MENLILNRSIDLVKVKIMIVDPNIKELPKYMKDGDACADIRSAEHVIIRPGEIKFVSTGIKMSLPAGYEGQIRPRSGLAKHGLMVINSPGTIDAGYRGIVGVLLSNIGSLNIEIKIGDRICQLSIKKVIQADFELVDELEDSERGEGGFGSTGLK